MGDSSLISYVARGQRRLELLELLNERERSQVELMKTTGMYKAHTSRALKELIEKKLIVCKNPGDRVFKFYKITKKGKDVLKEAKKLIL
ncbi:MAG: MarR family winged helix-turn-helix transcriptional regulator [Candidatus Pacearchaeota archaeon]